MKNERTMRAMPGLPMLFLLLLLMAVWIWALISIKQVPMYAALVGAVSLVMTLVSIGFFVNQPNTATALVLFGKYVGTVKEDGFYWANPFYAKQKVSLRAQTLNGQQVKVNDHAGNPVEIAAVVVWRVHDTYRALFDVEKYADYVAMQSETALRHLATSYPYDAEDHEISLMRNTDEVSDHLQAELSEKLDRAGIEVLEARLSHLAYAQEIAGVMLRKQQAAAIIAARQRIVDGAVGMVELALGRMDREKIVDMDPERKAQMVSNLMVILCGESNVQPVINTGSIH